MQLDQSNVGFSLKETFTEKQRCSGCGACTHVCPSKCIKLKKDDEGFLYPIVDNALCVNCRKCANVCPVINAKPKSDVIKGCFVGYYKDVDRRIKSSSGGIFYPLAKSILIKWGLVFGVAFDEELKAHHIHIDKEADLPLLMGSKYMQSRTEETYVECKEALDNDRWVLYSGVACQIAGLKAYLGKDYEKLLTVDVLCHGAPSPEVWALYLKYRANKAGADPKDVSFRDKVRSWSDFCLRIDFENEKQFLAPHNRDYYYYYYFLANVGLRPSCHHCAYRGLERASDLTIGDAWGINGYMPEFNDEKGVSAIITHTDKGNAFLTEIKDSLELKDIPIEMVLPPSSGGRKDTTPYPTRAQFFRDFADGKDYQYLIDHDLPKHWPPKAPLWRRVLSKGKRILKKMLGR